MKPLFSDPKELLLIQRVSLVFLEKGMKAMTMDDISVELHVSKKTLYKYVKNRAELVKKCVQLRVHKEMENRTLIQSAGLNAIVENLRILEFSSQVIGKAAPKAHEELQRFFPDAFAVIENYKNDFLIGSVKKNIAKGIQEGLYFEGVDPEVIAKMYVAKIDLVFSGNTFPPEKFNFAEVLSQIIIHHMRGMATSKGIKIIEKHTGKQYN